MVNYNSRDFAHNECSLYTVYRSFTMMQKTIAMVINKFRVRETFISGLVWVPAKFSDEFLTKKDEINNRAGCNLIVKQRVIDEELVVPTCYSNNEFSSPF